jgi:uncharacterized protein
MSQEQNTTPVVTVEPIKTEETKTTSTTSVSQDNKNLALLAHLSGFLFSFIVPLIIYLVKTEDAFVREEAKEALNFQILIAISYFVCTFLWFLIFPALLLPVIWVVNLVFCIIAAVAVSDGKSYKYPFNLRLIK